jgi:hypothetical protein
MKRAKHWLAVVLDRSLVGMKRELMRGLWEQGRLYYGLHVRGLNMGSWRNQNQAGVK